MGDVAAPVVAPSLDTQANQVGVDLARGADALGLARLLAGAEEQLALVVERDVGVVGRHVGQEGAGRVVVERRIHPVAEVAAGVIDAREAHAALEEVRATEREDRGVRGAKVEAQGQRAGVGAAHLVHKRHELVADGLVVGLLARGALRSVAGAAPGLVVHVVDAEELDDAGVEVVGELVHEPDLLEVLGRLALRGKRHDGLARGAVDVDDEVLAEVLAVTNNHLLIHIDYSPVSNGYQNDGGILALIGEARISLDNS